MKFEEIPKETDDNEFVFIECDITGKTKKTRYGVAKANVVKNHGKYITNWGLAKLNNPMKQDAVKEKVKKTNLEKYGTTLPMNSEENIQKRKELFEDENFVQQRTAKSKETCITRYGVEHHMMNKEIQDKQKQVMQEKYGVDHPLQNEEIKEKMRQTCQEKYGIDNVAQLPEVRIKMAKTMLEKYGVDHYNKLPEMKDYLREHCKDWLAESYANPWSKGIIRPEAWNQKQRETVTLLMMAGQWKCGYPKSKKGFCFPKKCEKDSVYFRSSYEAIYCYYLDNNPDVKSFSFESFRIPYDFEGKTRFYVPDFLVKWQDNRMSIKELKAEFLRDDEQQLAKRYAGEIFAQCNDMDYDLLFNADIEKLNISFEMLKSIGFVA